MKYITSTVLPEHQDLVAKGGSSLRALCQKEVDLFDQYLRREGGLYAEGLAKFERSVLEGYLYQKLRGRVDGESPSELMAKKD